MTKKPIAAILFYLALFFLLVLAFAPISLWMPDAGLDSSWVAMTNEAFVRDWKWGKDVAFTYGPFGFLVLRQFNPSTWMLQALFWVAMALILATVLWKSFRGLPLPVSIVLTWIFLVCIIGVGDLIFFSIPFIALLLFSPQKGMLRNWLVYLLAALAALGALIKFSYAPYPFVLFLLMDSYAIYKEKKASYLSLVFVGGVLIGFALAGQSLADFPEWIRLSLAVSAGYGVAMQSTGPWLEIASYVLVAVVFIALTFAFRTGKGVSLQALLFLCGVVLCLLMVQKAAFVRHDSHGLISWNVLSTLAVFYFAYLWKKFPSRGPRVIFCGLLALNFGLYFFWVNQYFQGTFFEFGLRSPYNIMSGNFGIIRAFLKHPGKFREDKNNEYRDVLAAISEKSGLGVLEGSVDYIPSRQMEAIANGYDYRPRPIFQSYSVYMPYLIDRHVEFFSSPRAPQNVIFGLDDIDGRYPGSSEGGAWPALLRAYDPSDFRADKLILKKRSLPRKVELKKVRRHILKFGKTINLAPFNSAPLWMAVKFEENLLGLVARMFFKGPILTAKVVTDSKQKEEFRIVPTISERGQLASPLVRTALDFAALYSGEIGVVSHKVKTISFHTSKFGELLYPRIAVDLYQVQIERGFEEAPKVALNELLAEGELINKLDKVRGSLEIRVENNRYFAFAHAASLLRLPIPVGAKKLKLSYGIQPGAWRGEGNTDGVCFRAYTPPDNSDNLFKECLQPKVLEADRSERTREIDIQQKGSELLLSTECLGNCYWDWAYWTDLEFSE